MGRTRFLGAILAAIGLPGCAITRTLVHNFADLDDHRIFDNRVVPGSGDASRLRELRRVPAFLDGLQLPDETGRRWHLDEYLARTRTAAFVALHEDRVVLERYGRGYDHRSLLNSFSIAKSIVSVLTGIALADGLIDGLDTAVASVCPEFAGTPYGPVTMRELLTMTSGVVDAPSMLPGRAEVYYGDDLRAFALRARAAYAGGRPWRYSETDVQVLGFMLERAAGMPVSQYLATKLWRPLGMESPALWALDRQGGSEKTFCCLSARARDFARFGKLMLDGGRWNGRQLVPQAWVERSVLPGIRTPDGYTHRHLWWSPPDEQGDYFAYGHNGQYLYVHPAARVVIVKFSETRRQDPVPAFRALAAAVSAPAHVAELNRLDAPMLAAR